MKIKRPKWFDDSIPDDFQHQVQADLFHFHIQEVMSKWKKHCQRGGIVAAIDKATGYDVHVQKELVKDLKYCLKHFINHAGALGYDVSGSVMLLESLKKFKL